MFGIKKNKHKVRADTSSYAAIWMTSDENILPIGYHRLTDNEEVRKCVNKIASLVSSMTIMIMENGEKGDKRIRNQLSKQIDIYPSKIMTRKTFIHKLVTDLLIFGNSVVYPKVGRNGLPEDHIIFDMKSVSFHKKGTSYVISYKGQEFQPDELLHFVLIPDDSEPFRGVGYVKQVKTTVENLIQAQDTKSKFLRSKWKPPLIISIQADDEFMQDREKREKILSSYRDDTEAGEPWLIPAGEIDVKEVRPLTLNDLAIQDSITLDKRSVASAFNLPPFMVGVGDFNKEAYNNLIATEILSIALILQQEFTRKESINEKQYFKLNPRSLMQYDIGELTSHVIDMTSGGMMNRNEGRNQFDYSPVDDAGMDDYIVLENYIPVSKVKDQKKLKEGNASE